MLRLFINHTNDEFVSKCQFQCPDCGKFLSYNSYKGTGVILEHSPFICMYCFSRLPRVEKIAKDKDYRLKFHKNQELI